LHIDAVPPVCKYSRMICLQDFSLARSVHSILLSIIENIPVVRSAV
jgi:hypothetical protein